MTNKPEQSPWKVLSYIAVAVVVLFGLARWFSPGMQRDKSVAAPAAGAALSTAVSDGSEVYAALPAPRRATDAGCTAPQLAPGPHPQPDYPQDANLAGQQGSVDLGFVVEVDGSVSVHGLTVQKSSGSTSLDDAAIASLIGFHFTPGTCNGQTVRMTHAYRVTFKLEHAGAAHGSEGKAAEAHPAEKNDGKQ